jgi:predicted DNA-binding antitoxin AbrB/MazE fold protein
MAITVEAVYLSGVLKPLQPLPLKDHEKVRLIIQPGATAAERTAGMLKWTGSHVDLRQVAEDDQFGIMESS